MEPLVSFPMNETANGHGMSSPASDIEKSLDDVQLEHVAASPSSVHQGRSQDRRLLSASAIEGKRICRHCRWIYPNAQPSAKIRRKHKRRCGAAFLAGANGTSDEELHRLGAVAENGFDDSSTNSEITTSDLPQKLKEVSLSGTCEQDGYPTAPGSICSLQVPGPSSSLVEISSNSPSTTNVANFAEVISIDQPVFHSFGQSQNGVTAAWTNLNVASITQTLEEPEFSKFQEVKDKLSTSSKSGESPSSATGKPSYREETTCPADQALVDKLFTLSNTVGVEVGSTISEAIPSDSAQVPITDMISLKHEPAAALEMVQTISLLGITQSELSISQRVVLGKENGPEVCAKQDLSSELDSAKSPESASINEVPSTKNIINEVTSTKIGDFGQVEVVDGSACEVPAAKETVPCRVDSSESQMRFNLGKTKPVRKGREVGAFDSSGYEVGENLVAQKSLAHTNSSRMDSLSGVLDNPQVEESTELKVPVTHQRLLHDLDTESEQRTSGNQAFILSFPGLGNVDEGIVMEDAPASLKSTSVTGDWVAPQPEVKKTEVHEVSQATEQARFHPVTRTIGQAKVHEVAQAIERAEVLEVARSPEPCSSPGSPEGLVRTRVEEFEKLAGLQRTKCFNRPSTSTSPRTPVSKSFSSSSSTSPRTPGSRSSNFSSSTSPLTPGSAKSSLNSSPSCTSPRAPGRKSFSISTSTSPRTLGSKSFSPTCTSSRTGTPRSTLQYGSAEKSLSNLHHGPKELKEAISHPRREQQSHVKAATQASQHDHLPEVQGVMSHLRHRGTGPEVRVDKQKVSKVVDSKPVTAAQHNAVLVCHG